MPRLIIHIGTQKTGTSVLQEFCSTNRDLLLKQGINYSLHGLGLSKTASHHANHLLAHHMADGWLTSKFPEGEFSRVWKEFIPSVLNCDPNQTILISSEHFYKAGIMSPTSIQKIRDNLPGVDVQIVVYLRRPDTFALSNWAHSVKTNRNFRMSFEDYAMSTQFGALLNYEQNIAAWTNVFGSENITVKIFNREYFKNGDIIDDFFDVIGVKRTQEFKNVGNVNVSLSPLTLEMLHNLDRPEIIGYKNLVLALEELADNETYKARVKELTPLNEKLASYLINAFGEGYLRLARQSLGKDATLEVLDPGKYGDHYIGLSDEIRHISVSLWNARHTNLLKNKRS